MVCYASVVRWITAVGLVGWLLWHREIGHLLSLAGLALGMVLAACAAAAAATLAVRMARRIQRRRSRAGACLTCRFRCQSPMTAGPPAGRQPLPIPIPGPRPRSARAGLAR
jgi:hypothetical protein